MNAFTYHVPTKVIFGENTETQAGQAIRDAGGSNVLVIYGGGSAVRNGLLDRVTASLEAVGLPWQAVGGVQPNPHLGLAQETVDKFRDKGIDFVLAVGGGSVIDTAKAVAHGLARPDVPIWDYYSGKAKVTATLKKDPSSPSRRRAVRRRTPPCSPTRPTARRRASTPPSISRILPS